MACLELKYTSTYLVTFCNVHFASLGVLRFLKDRAVLQPAPLAQCRYQVMLHVGDFVG